MYVIVAEILFQISSSQMILFHVKPLANWHSKTSKIWQVQSPWTKLLVIWI